MPKRHRPGVSANSVLAHVEEILLATSGADPFEVVFALAAKRVAGRAKHPELGVVDPIDLPRDLLARVDELLGRALASSDRFEALDAIFETLVSRVAKGAKGQFFTPRHVVDFVVRALALQASETVIDPACGSGAFLTHARAHALVKTYGCDVDLRAVRVARLLALAGGDDPERILRGDGLRTSDLPHADVVATNPPFAGRADANGFEVADLVHTPERDVLFLERALDLLVPGGRLGIVLPYNKAAGRAFAKVRRWLVARARLLAVVGLPRETFLPHTAIRTFVLFAKKRRKSERFLGDERTMLLLSEKAGKDAAGEPSGGHDLAEVEGELFPFLRAEGFSS